MGKATRGSRGFTDIESLTSEVDSTTSARSPCRPVSPPL